MKDKVEAVLFAAGRFVDEDHLVELLQSDRRAIRTALQELKEDYEERKGETCLQIIQEDASWKMHVRDEYLDLVSKLVSDKEIAKTVLETLAVIAWKTPMLQADVVKIRGPAAYEHIGELIERGFITKEPSGRTFKLKVTDKFFDYFDVEGREDIRSMFKRVEDEAAAQQADVDRSLKEYEEKQAVAAAMAAEIGEGVDPLDTRDTDPSPSAQNLDGEERASGRDPADEPGGSRLEQETEDLEREIAALGDDIEDLKDEEAHRLDKPAGGEEDEEPRPKPHHTHPAHKKKTAHRKKH